MRRGQLSIALDIDVSTAVTIGSILLFVIAHQVELSLDSTLSRFFILTNFPKVDVVLGKDADE